jgi:two-component system, NarL family, sensor kinase
VLPAAVEVAAYRIVVEAVTNTVRHARARHCQVSMARTPAGLAIEVTDDGTGLAAAGQPGHGLAIMRERAEELGGTVTIRDRSPGVTVQARLPAVTTPAPLSSVPAVPA